MWSSLVDRQPHSIEARYFEDSHTRVIMHVVEREVGDHLSKNYDVSVKSSMAGEVVPVDRHFLVGGGLTTYEESVTFIIFMWATKDV